MRRPGGVRWLRRWWPQKVRTRLTLLYAGLFFIAGSALLGVTYGLVASSLPAGRAQQSNQKDQAEAKLQSECKKEQGKAGAAAPASRAPACQLARAYAAGTSAGSQTQRDRTLHNLLAFSLAGLGMMTAASGWLGWVVSGRVLRPVRVITETARRASEQHLGERLALTGPRDELKELADTFDDMLERLDQAFSTQRRFIGNASHELRTPLTVMRTAIDVTLAKPSRTQQQLEDMAVRVRRSIAASEDMIEALLTLTVSDQGTASSEFIDVATCAEDALDAARAEVERLGLRVETKLDPAETAGDRHLLERMVGNLVGNAVRHNVADGWVRVRTGTEHGAVFLDVANSGPVIPADAVPSLFEPFRRMEERTGVRDGVGLGLSIARAVINAHGATVSASAQPEGGLDIKVVIPRGRMSA
jgi:signal transduction histidine kinase